jgi:hypothetical protein
MRVLIIIFTSLLSIGIYSQERSVNSIQTSFGLNHSSLQDLVFSPLVFRGMGNSFGLKYRNEKSQRKHGVTFTLSSQALNPILNSSSITQVQNTFATLDYQFTKLVKSSKWKYYFGGGFYNLIAAKNIEFVLEDEVSLDLFSSFHFVGSMSRVFGTNHDFSVTFSYPIFSYVVGRMRVPLDFPMEILNALFDNPDNFPVGSLLRSGDFLTITDFIDLRTRLNYEYRISNHWRIGFTYRFRYYQYPKFLNVRNGTSEYFGTISFVF